MFPARPANSAREPFDSIRNTSTREKGEGNGEESRCILKVRNEHLVRRSLQIGSALCRPRTRRAGDWGKCDSDPLQEVDDGGHSRRVFPSFRPGLAARRVR